MVSSEDLQHLMASTVWPAVSIYLPAMAAGQKATSNQTRFGRLAIAAEDRLIQGGLAATEARALMSVSQEPLRREDFWRPQDRGLAMFIGPGMFHTVKLPYDVAEEVVVGRLFHVTPLLPAMAGEDRYHVLAVSANRARLFEGRRHSFRLRGDVSLPPGIGEVHAESEYQASRHAAPQSRPRANGAASMARQQSLGEDPEELRKAHLIEYLHRLAGSVRSAIGFDPVPLVLVAQPEVDGHFRKLYGEKNLWPQTLQRNPEALTTSQLHCHSLELVKDSFQGPRERALEQFNTLWGDASPKAATKPEEIVKAARYGRVDTLFVAAGAHLWGHYEEAADRVVAHGSPTGEDDDLLDYAAIETITKGGRVEVVTELPRGQVMAALLRY